MPDVKAVLLTGAGERVFCAGVDVREKPRGRRHGRQRERRSHALAALQDAVMDTPKPVIVVLNGTASGGGAMLALLADACVAADTAALSLPEIDLGIATFSGANILEVDRRARARARPDPERAPHAGAAKPSARGLGRSRGAAGRAARAPRRRWQDCWAPRIRHAFADNKRWINRSLKAALAEARDEHARHREMRKDGEPSRRHQRRDKETTVADLEISTTDRVMVARLNRPEKKNALSEDMLELLRDALRSANDDPDDRLLRHHGRGRRVLLRRRPGPPRQGEAAGIRRRWSAGRGCRRSRTRSRSRSRNSRSR